MQWISEFTDEQIIKQYNSKNRYYHNFDHILFIKQLCETKQIALGIDQQLAILFHDYVYDTSNSYYNELKSAEELLNFFRNTNKYDYESIKNAYSIILHTTPAQHLEYNIYLSDATKIVLDLDLSVIGTKSYIHFIDKLYMEYHNINNFYEKRKVFLNTMLNKPYIFYNEHLFEEKLARYNLMFELKMLEVLT